MVTRTRWASGGPSHATSVESLQPSGPREASDFGARCSSGGREFFTCLDVILAEATVHQDLPDEYTPRLTARPASQAKCASSGVVMSSGVIPSAQVDRADVDCGAHFRELEMASAAIHISLTPFPMRVARRVRISQGDRPLPSLRSITRALRSFPPFSVQRRPSSMPRR
jgi:hypothetical protein